MSFEVPISALEVSMGGPDGTTRIIKAYVKLNSITNNDGDISFDLSAVPGMMPGGHTMTVTEPSKPKASPRSKHFPQGLRTAN